MNVSSSVWPPSCRNGRSSEFGSSSCRAIIRYRLPVPDPLLCSPLDDEPYPILGSDPSPGGGTITMRGVENGGAPAAPVKAS
jgi:hypothetical protein